METMKELTCAEVVEILSDYLEKALGPELSKMCSEHLAECEDCEGYLRGLVHAISVAGALRANATEVPMGTLMALYRAWCGPARGSS